MHHDNVQLHHPQPLPPPNPRPTTVPSYTLQFLRYGQRKILKVKVTTVMSKVKSRSHHDVAQLHTQTNAPTKYQFPKSLRFPRQSPDKIFKVKVVTARLNVKSRSHHDITPLTKLSILNIGFLHLTFSEIQPRQTFPAACQKNLYIRYVQ